MSLARMVHLVIGDVEQIIRLYHQLCDVPPDVQKLFNSIQSTNSYLHQTESIVARQNVSALFADYVAHFRDFRGRLIELELFIDPNQLLARSGPKCEDHGPIPWQYQADVSVKCIHTKHLLHDLEGLCRDLLSALSTNEKQSQSPMQSPPPRPQIEPASLSPASLDTFLQAQYKLLSPLLSPLGSPNITVKSSPPPVSYFSLSESTYPIPVPSLPDPGQTLANLPSKSKRKRRDKTLAEKRVQQLIQSQYSQSLAAGQKRKRPSDQARSNTPLQSPSTAEHLFPINPPPGYPPSSPKLNPHNVTDDTHPNWSLDDLASALPTATTSNAKGKQRASNSPNTTPSIHSPDLWDTGSSVNTTSSSASIHSSILSVASHDRTYDPGACKIWYTHGTKLTQVPIRHIELKHASVPSGDCISVYALMSSNQIIRDDLWMSAQRSNASPFFENEEVVNAMRFHDESIACIVKMAPNPAGHPSYSFAKVRDGWEFMQSIVGRLLVCSVNVASIKSACTHGNSVECGTDTIQVWEDVEDVDGARSRKGRTVKFFRNRNSGVSRQLVEFSCNTLRPPEMDGKSGKVTFRFRDAREGLVREMKYLKIAFSSDDDRETFLHEVGFPGHITSTKA